jgi:SAM-dependent methyltransferase
MAGSGGWEQWEWDESLFAGAAGYYEQGRLPYAPGLADALAHDLGLDGRGRLLDVGCGPGTVARRLAPLFEAVVGLDPDPGMLAEAARLATVAGIRHATWVRERAEALPAGLGSSGSLRSGLPFTGWTGRGWRARYARCSRPAGRLSRWMRRATGPTLFL